MASKSDKASSAKSLTCLLQAMHGRLTTVELRNETSLQGCIKHVDGFMNTEMTNVLLETPSGSKYRFETFYIQGKHIRFVHIPDDVNVIDTIQKQLSHMTRTRTYQEKTVSKDLLARTRYIRQTIALKKNSDLNAATT